MGGLPMYHNGSRVLIPVDANNAVRFHDLEGRPLALARDPQGAFITVPGAQRRRMLEETLFQMLDHDGQPIDLVLKWGSDPVYVDQDGAYVNRDGEILDSSEVDIVTAPTAAPIAVPADTPIATPTDAATTKELPSGDAKNWGARTPWTRTSVEAGLVGLPI